MSPGPSIWGGGGGRRGSGKRRASLSSPSPLSWQLSLRPHSGLTVVTQVASAVRGAGGGVERRLLTKSTHAKA